MAHASALKLALADGQDETVVLPRVLKLTTTSATTSLSSSESFDAEHPWTLVKDGKGLTRTFRFKTFKDTWAFMSAIAEQCKRAKHHPEWFNSYNRTDITWTTHRPEGLTTKDVEMAEYCDQQGREFGEVKLREETANCATGKK